MHSFCCAVFPGSRFCIVRSFTIITSVPKFWDLCEVILLYLSSYFKIRVQIVTAILQTKVMMKQLSLLEEFAEALILINMVVIRLRYVLVHSLFTIFYSELFAHATTSSCIFLNYETYVYHSAVLKQHTCSHISLFFFSRSWYEY
jgi:hypothetical protein